MTDSDRKDLILVVIAVVGFAATLIGLAADIPQVSGNPLGQFFLILVLLAAVAYIAYFTYTRLLKAHLETQKCLADIKAMIVEFTSRYADNHLEGNLDLDLINLIIATKRMKKANLEVTEVQYLPNDKMKIVIDKGHSDGLLARMLFKVFHSSHLDALGTCGCTTAHDQATLVITIDENSPVAISEIGQDNIEVRLIEPVDNSRFNSLLANLLYRLDFGS